MDYFFHIAQLLAVFALLSMSLNLIVGYCGYLSLAHASYFALGAYAYAITSIRWDAPFMAAFSAALAVPLLFSPIISIASWKLRGDAFVVASLAVQACFVGALRTWSDPSNDIGTWPNMTNGSAGIAGIPAPSIFGWDFTSPGHSAALAWAVVSVVGFVMWRLQLSPWARLLRCIRDDEPTALGLGKRVWAERSIAFAIACAIAGCAGSLHAASLRFVDPSIATLDWSILLLSMVLVGGAGNVVGAWVGAAFVLALPEALRFADVSGPRAGNIRVIVFGALLIVLMHVRPQGLAGEYRVE